MERDNRAARPGADGVGCAVIRIAISVEAFDAIAATLPFVSVEQAINEHGPRYVWLKRSVLERLLGNGARTIIVESPDRFARDLIQQLLGRDMLKAKGAALIAASAPQHFTEDTPTAVLVRQILGGVAEFEKTTLVAKLKAARERKKAVTGKCGGRKSFAERDATMVALAKKLRRYPVNGRKRSLRDIAVALEAQGYLNERGKLFNPKSVAAMLA